jgi:uncharacterized secreted repeat protein (TIGR03808 family)
MDRRELMLGMVGFGVTLVAGPRAGMAREAETPQALSPHGVVPGGLDQTATLQAAIDAAAQSGIPFFLPAGTYTTSKLTLKSGTQIQGVPGRSILKYKGGEVLLSIEDAACVHLSGLTLDGDARPLKSGGALLAASGAQDLVLSSCRFLGSSEGGVVLRKVSGRISDCEIGDIRNGGLFSEDANGLEISHNHVHDCGDNAIQIWRSVAGEDGTIVSANHIERVVAKSGGGQTGNGINVFRAGSVIVSGNRISDCAFSAVRVTSGSDCQIVGNSCARLGDVALYAESTFEGVLIANNLVDKAAMGISVTNVKQGGRLALVQGNRIHNLFFRKDIVSRGIGIAVEADAVVSTNVIEGVPAFGIMIGWSSNIRDVRVTDNLVRNAHIGIGVAASGAGYARITENIITGAKDGAIRAMDGPKPIGPDLAHAQRRGLPQSLSLFQRRRLA